MGQGGAQAIEDALALATMISDKSSAIDTGKRLALYEQARKERAERIQNATRIRGSTLSELAHIEFDVLAEREYQFRHNEIEHSRELLASHAI